MVGQKMAASVTQAWTLPVSGNNGSWTSDLTTGGLPAGVVLSRASGAGVWNGAGLWTLAGNDIPRWGTDPVTGSPLGLVLEGARTNELLQSRDLSTWSYAANITRKLNFVTSPDGTVNAPSFVPDTTAAYHWLGGGNNVSLTAGQSFSFSGFFKRLGTGAGSRYFRFAFRNSSSSYYVGVDIDLQTPTVQAYLVGTGSSLGAVSITPLANGWYRIAGENAVLGGGTTSAVLDGQFISGLGGSYAGGDGTSGLSLWGVQFEKKACLSSYIPTTTSTVTRAADFAVMNSLGALEFNPAQGTFFIECTLQGDISAAGAMARNILTISDATGNNRVALTKAATSGSLGMEVVAGGSTLVNGVVVANAQSNMGYRLAMAYRDGDYAAVANGGSVVTSTAGGIPSGLNQLALGGAGYASQMEMFGYIRRVAYMPLRLSNSQLRSLTE